MTRLLVVLAVVGCASGKSPLAGDASVDAAPDGPVEQFVDAAIDASIDAPIVPIDAMIDAPIVPIDAPMIDAPMIDAPPDACVMVTTELLVNPVFDLAPLGVGWQAQPIDPMYPIITSDDGIPEHSAPYKAWLGGFEAPTASVTDQLYQDVLVPAGTTQLVLTGFYETRTNEASTATTVYDSAQLAITQTNGTPITTVLSLSNLAPTTAWTPIDYTVPQNLAGQTVRIRMTSSNDFLNATSFYFDTLALRATYCP